MPWFWKNNHRSNQARQDSIVFASADCGIGVILVHFWHHCQPQTESWHTYDAIGDAATKAVEAAGWNYQELQELAESFLRKEIDRPSAEARLASLKLKSSQRKARGSICLGGVE